MQDRAENVSNQDKGWDPRVGQTIARGVEEPLAATYKWKGATTVVIHGNVADLDMDKEEATSLKSTIKALQKSPKFRPLFD